MSYKIIGVPPPVTFPMTTKPMDKCRCTFLGGVGEVGSRWTESQFQVRPTFSPRGLSDQGGGTRAESERLQLKTVGAQGHQSSWALGQVLGGGATDRGVKSMRDFFSRPCQLPVSGALGRLLDLAEAVAEPSVVTAVAWA